VVLDSFLNLKKYCESQQFKGWDPYDGLNSKVFKNSFLNNYEFSRLLWIQFFKLSPINLRKPFMIKKEYNPKGIALLLSGYCNLYKLSKDNLIFGKELEIKERINFLSSLLINLKSKGYSGSCWGYNFDWQARNKLYFPKNTPNIVTTSFCIDALNSVYELFGEKNILNEIISSADFVNNDLKKTKLKNGFFFSYSPLEGNNTVFNASLMGAKILSYVYHHTNDETIKEVASDCIKTVCSFQKKDGSWSYGLLKIQSWIDSFHTAYNLVSIKKFQELTETKLFENNIDSGFNYYINNFFSENGEPKYYNNQKYPIDIHCPAQLITTLSELNIFSKYQELAEKVLKWTILNMQDKNGYFYFQKRRFFINKNSYMRWSNAFMFNAMSNYLIEHENE
tara:strand:+ start:2332 stop:3513 length:1182 start_codon:yes stop_codon:yes gene_type:complete